MKESIKEKIYDYLKGKQGWVFGGQIEDFIRTTDGHKASNSSRRCRELEDEGRIERRLVNVQGVANKVVQYRIKDMVSEQRGKKIDDLVKGNGEWWKQPEYQRPQETVTQGTLL